MKVKMMQVGPIVTNCYFLIDTDSNQMAVIDPGDEPELIQEAMEETGAQVTYTRRRRSISTRPTPTGRAASCSPWRARWMG